LFRVPTVFSLRRQRAVKPVLIWKREHPVFCSSEKESTRCSADLEKRAPGVLLIWKREHPVFC
jgi:hypothetical protein